MANKELQVRISVYGGTKANWTTQNPVLLQDEIGYERDTGKLKIGDGATAWNDLAYFMGSIEGVIANYMLTADYKGSANGVVKAADKLQTARKINGVAFDGTADITVADSTKIPLTQMGVANGVAELDESGKVPSDQLPSYVDDVIEGYLYNGSFYKESAHNTAITGEQGKIYTDLDTGNIYRWSGSAFVSISNPLDIATESEATVGTNNTKAMTPLRVEQAISNKGYITSEEVAEGYEPAFTKNTAFNKNFGTAAGTVTEGNDARLSDARIPKGTAGGDLTGSYPNPTIANAKVTTAKIADAAITSAKLASAAVTDAKIAAGSLSTTKLFVPSGDVLVLNGGNITA